MKVEEIAEVLGKKHGGCFYTVTLRRPAKVRKPKKGEEDHPAIVKESQVQGLSCDYADRLPVKEAMERGDREPPVLPSYIQESFEVNGVRFWRGKNGVEYLPIVLGGNTPSSKWFKDGQEVEKDEIKEFLLASELTPPADQEKMAEKGQAPFISVSVENIVSVV